MIVLTAPTVVFVVVLGVLDISFSSTNPSTCELMVGLSSEYYSVVTAENGSTLCAVDDASALKSATNRVRCGHLCLLQPFCYLFNYFAKTNRCAVFYNTPPQKFSVLDGCRSYTVQKQPRALTIIADEIVADVYADGLRIPSVPVYGNLGKLGTFFFPGSTRILAIRLTNAISGYGAILASEINGNLVTNSKWKVLCNYTDGWMDSTFEDSGWEEAYGFSVNPSPIYGDVPSISREAEWITSPRDPYSKVLYYRVYT